MNRSIFDVQVGRHRRRRRRLRRQKDDGCSRHAKWKGDRVTVNGGLGESICTPVTAERTAGVSSGSQLASSAGGPSNGSLDREVTRGHQRDTKQ